MSVRARVVAILVLAGLLLGGTAAYVLRSRADQHTITAGSSQPTAPRSLIDGPRIVFRHTELGPDYGKVAMVALGAPQGARAITDLRCDRVFATAVETMCLASDPGLVTTHSAVVRVDATGRTTDLPLAGSPSRARMSADGRYAATTSFVAGDSYADNSFSTRTVVTRLADDTTFDLETFALYQDGRRITPVDRNYWGVTFAPDDDTFFVTVAFGGRTHLAQGRLSTRRVDTLRTDAECPSLSPDGTKVAYKKRGDRARGDWRLVVLDRATGEETELAERRSVDDQVEWLDADHILYGLPGDGSRAAESNVWMVNSDGTGEPTLLIAHAWSPAVVR